MTTDPETGESVRGFQVLIHCKPNALCLPCTGQPLYTGEQAMNVMRDYQTKRNLITEAHTESKHGGFEVLTLREMEEIYDLSIHPNI